VLVFPVYWWSRPALLKGWIDCVFTNGWAYTFDASGKVVGNLRERKVHLIGIGASGPQKYESHGHRQAVVTQIQHGIFEYCGIGDVRTTLLLESESRQPGKREAHLREAFELGRTIAAHPLAPATLADGAVGPMLPEGDQA
jgi:NAD(P)H dehydrogenase (quinone)